MKIGLDSAASPTPSLTGVRPRSPHLLPLRRLLKTKRTKSQSRNGVIIGKGAKDGGPRMSREIGMGAAREGEEE